MVKAKVFIFTKHFDGLPKESDFNLVEERLPAVKNGEFLAEAVYLSVDPYMKGYASIMPTGDTFIGSQVARIIESKNPKYPVGKYVVGPFGWRSHTISNGEISDKSAEKKIPYLLPELGNLPVSLGVGALGMPGNTAYFGFLELCQPKSGETVVVSGAGGAVGSLVGQIAKIKGCKVIGIAGSDEKGKWLVNELGFDHFLNYKSQDLHKELKQVAPKGIDCYFDNVGGETSSIVMSQMNRYGRVSICGLISAWADLSKAVVSQSVLVSKELRVEGFLVNRWLDRWMEGIKQNLKWIKEGKLKYRETVTEGFENMVIAFVDMLNGGNVGKAVVKV